MHVLRKVALGILSPMFIFLLFVTAFDIGFIRTATHPATVKEIVADSGIYDTVVPNLLQQAKVISTPVGNIDASDPAVKAAASQAISPQAVQTQANAAIDSIYQWLDGQTGQPSFTIGIGANTSGFADSISQSVQQKLAGLPACTTAQNLAISNSGSSDAVNATCLPRGVTAAQVAAQVKNAITSNQDFINQASINADSIKSSNSGPSVFEQPNVKSIPKKYQDAKKTPGILIILTILTGAGIVFLSSSWQKGLRHIGINLVTIGLIMLAFSYGLNRAVSTKIAPKIQLDNAVLQQDIRHLITDVSQQIDKNYWYFGGIYTLLGATAMAGGHIAVRRKQYRPPPGKSDLEPTPTTKE